jgi:hypothetical protein
MKLTQANLGNYFTLANSLDHFAGNRRIIPAREHDPYVEAFWAWCAQCEYHARS